MSGRFLSVAFLAICFQGVAPTSLRAQVATERPKAELRPGYPAEWPSGPPASSVPDWAQPGQIRFSRWDGGPIETAKAFLSGWPGMNPPIPDYLYVMTNWYDPSTIQYLRDANINTIWVTFSNGFSIESEKVQRDLLQPYIQECHRHGIRVFAYFSLTNLFWEDMYEHVPDSKNWIGIGPDGQPIRYAAGDYAKMGRVTRYLANLPNPKWRDYLKRRIDLAVDAGVDGLFYDNCGVPIAHLADAFQEIMPYALGKKKDLLVMANFHRQQFILNRLVNAISTEEGGEAGIFSDENIDKTRYRWKNERPYMRRVEGGYLANNIGLFRLFENLSEGWKPVMIESRLRESGTAETEFMRAERQKLVLAENMMFNVANETFIELRFAHALKHADPEALRAWAAIGHYNRFLADNLQYYRKTRSLATLAVVLDNTSGSEAFLNGLAGRNVRFHVLYEHELTPERLKPYAAVALLTTATVRARALEAMKQYVEEGGKVFAAAGAAKYDENGNGRERPAWFGKKLGRGEAVYWETSPSIEEWVEALKKADRLPFVRLDAPPGVLYNVREQADTGRIMIHLTNYLPHPVDNVRVTVTGKPRQVRLLTPDETSEPSRTVQSKNDETQIEIPRLTVYSVLVLN